MAHYKKPSGINPVSILILLALGGLVYAGVKFGPPYWRDRSVTNLLNDAVNRLYRDRGVPGIEQTIRDDVLTQMRAMGIDDPGLTVTLETTGEVLRASASYTVVVSHPGRKITTLRFSPSAVTDTKSPFD